MASIEPVSKDCFKVSGELAFANVVAIRDQGIVLLDKADSDVEISLAGVTRAGSAAVSLLLSWLRFAAEKEINLVFSHLPADLDGVARVSGIDQILPIASK
ncbi:MAG: STAS domain-containing protein [Pseudomonadales bacterium]|nr:STAS domain-containing protein [Pseudomonadales bacterium]